MCHPTGPGAKEKRLGVNAGSPASPGPAWCGSVLPTAAGMKGYAAGEWRGSEVYIRYRDERTAGLSQCASGGRAVRSTAVTPAEFQHAAGTPRLPRNTG